MESKQNPKSFSLHSKALDNLNQDSFPRLQVADESADSEADSNCKDHDLLLSEDVGIFAYYNPVSQSSHVPPSHFVVGDVSRKTERHATEVTSDSE
jgi:hypothetical protein